MKASFFSGLGFVAGTLAMPQFNFKRGNSTESAIAAEVPTVVSDHLLTTAAPEADGATTLTVATTEIKTITSCAPTVTNCPAEESELATMPAEELDIVIVTNTVVLSTTVCPVTEVASISSSIISDANEGKITGSTVSEVAIPTGSEITTSRPFSTIDATPDTTTIIKTMTTHIAVTKTFTLTMGHGETASTSLATTVVEEPTEVVSTVTETGLNSGVTTTNEDTTEGTTTTTMTTQTTSTIYVTDTGDKATETHLNSGNAGDEAIETHLNSGVTGGVGDSDEGICEPTTVTVTAPAETVYVTVDSNGSNTEHSGSTAETSTPSPENGSEAEYGNVDEAEEDYDEEEDCPVEDFEPTTTDDVDATTSDVVVDVTATVVPEPYFPSNGTQVDAPMPTGTSDAFPTAGYNSHRFARRH